MATERVIQCIHYVCEGSCDLGKKECRFWKEMQICPTYKKKPGALPARTDNRRQKIERMRRKEKFDFS